MNILTVNLAFSTLVFWVAARLLCAAKTPRRIGDLGQRTLPTTHVRGQDAENT